MWCCVVMQGLSPLAYVPHLASCVFLIPLWMPAGACDITQLTFILMASLWLGIDCNICSSDLLLAIWDCSQRHSLLGFHFKEENIRSWHVIQCCRSGKVHFLGASLFQGQLSQVV